MAARCVGEASGLVVAAGRERGGALEHDLAREIVALRPPAAVDAVGGIDDVQVEPRTEGGAPALGVRKHRMR